MSCMRLRIGVGSAFGVSQAGISTRKDTVLFSTCCFAIHTGIQALVFAFLVARSPSASSSALPAPCSSATASCNSSFSPSLTSIAIRCRLEIPSFFNSALSSCVDVGYCASLAVNAWRMLALLILSRFRLSAKVSGLVFFRAFK
jgi:hypothetical protein